MVNIVKHFETTKHLIDGGEVVLELRPHLGMSQLGHACSRYLWYQLHWAYKETVTKRLTRLFARGHREEPEIYKLLESIGYLVNSETLRDKLCEREEVIWDDKYNQLEMHYGFGHILGHADGTVEGVIEAPKTPHLLEIKTASDAKFKKFKKQNNLEKSHPQYFAQTQLYMHMLGLKRCLWLVVNKNDDDIHIERIRYDKGKAEDYLRKGDMILMCNNPPRAPFPPTFYECKWCSAKEICRNKAPMEQNCRTCIYSSIERDGVWNCTLEAGHPAPIPLTFQRHGCHEYEARENDEPRLQD